MYIVNIVSAIKIMTVNKENTYYLLIHPKKRVRFNKENTRYSMIRQKKKDLQSFSTRLIKKQYLILIILKKIINLA